MGPEMMLIAGAVGAGSQIWQAESQAAGMKAQAAADQARTATDAQWTERRALEERVAGQSAAAEETRKARLAQSRLGAVAGASGAGASDPTVMKMFEGIEGEGRNNAGMVQAGAEQKASGMTYQAALDRWSADANARIKRAAAKNTQIGGYLSGAASMGSSMANYYKTSASVAGGKRAY